MKYCKPYYTLSTSVDGLTSLYHIMKQSIPNAKCASVTEYNAYMHLDCSRWPFAICSRHGR